MSQNRNDIPFPTRGGRYRAEGGVLQRQAPAAEAPAAPQVNPPGPAARPRRSKKRGR